ncbi:MAG TPA: DUF1343 domain-containing protein, partial [Chitinophagales bacterium]|nr:DUF1343 domain-containing protein [Chitinophagales bacterium]
NLDTLKQQKFTLKYLINAYQLSSAKPTFFTSFFEKLAGTSTLRKQIESGMNENAIKATWQKDLNCFKLIRKKYLLYPDFKE